MSHTARYRGVILPASGRVREGTSARWQTTGKLTIDIQPGEIDLAWLKELIATVEGKSVSGAKPDGEGTPKLTRQEAVELLLWADTPDVIEPLVAAALRIPKDEPNSAAPDIIRALEKFFKRHERARNGILEIAADRRGEALETAIEVYDKEGVTIPGSWFAPVLNSPSVGSKWASLEYLGKHGTRDDVALVEALTQDENEQIAGLAAAVVKKLKARPPSAPPPKSAPKRK